MGHTQSCSREGASDGRINMLSSSPSVECFKHIFQHKPQERKYNIPYWGPFVHTQHACAPTCAYMQNTAVKVEYFHFRKSSNGKYCAETVFAITVLHLSSSPYLSLLTYSVLLGSIGKSGC